MFLSEAHAAADDDADDDELLLLLDQNQDEDDQDALYSTFELQLAYAFALDFASAPSLSYLASLSAQPEAPASAAAGGGGAPPTLMGVGLSGITFTC